MLVTVQERRVYHFIRKYVPFRTSLSDMADILEMKKSNLEEYVRKLQQMKLIHIRWKKTENEIFFERLEI